MKSPLLAMALFSAIAVPCYAENNRTDYDLDDDGLIEINDLNDLYEVRNHSSLSPYRVSLYGSEQGCANMNCTGFELTKDLDFDTNQNGVFDAGDAYWNGGEGWLPGSIGDIIFEGNGFVIRNLTINRPASDRQGLFESAAGTKIRRFGLVDVSINAFGGSGALAGVAGFAKVEGVFATGEVSGGDQGATLGGFFGHSTGMTVRNSFSGVNVTARWASGYLAGNAGADVDFYNILLVGKLNEKQPFDAPKSFNSYSYGTFHDSYLATDINGLPNDYRDWQDRSFGALLSKLKCPVSANNSSCIPEKTLYRNWPTQNDGSGIYWDFGTDQELPGLVLNGRLHRIDVTLSTSSSSSSSSSNSSSSSSSSMSSSSTSSATRSPASVPSSLRSSSSSSRSVSSCMGRSPASVPGSVSSRSSSSISSCWNWTAGPNPGLPSSSSSSSSSKKKASSGSSSSKRKKPKHY